MCGGSESKHDVRAPDPSAPPPAAFSLATTCCLPLSSCLPTYLPIYLSFCPPAYLLCTSVCSSSCVFVCPSLDWRASFAFGSVKLFFFFSACFLHAVVCSAERVYIDTYIHTCLYQRPYTPHVWGTWSNTCTCPPCLYTWRA